MSGLLSVFNLKNLYVSVYKVDDIFALKPVKLKIRANSKYFFGFFFLRIKIFQDELVLPYLKGEGIFSFNTIFPRRGKYNLEEIEVSSYFPFYFFRRTAKIPINLELIVFPHPLKCDLSFLGKDGKGRVDSSISRGKSYDGDLIGVRDYVDGDPLKYVHWKASAKTYSLKTKEFSPFQGNPILINLNDFSGTIEERISKATFALIEFSKRGNPVGLRLGDEIFSPDTGQGHLRRMLHALAVYNPE
ncbi:MAG: DUF58 domain-containing protein [Thermodesulfovibrio sp.]|nr:DUF58 domain-containing protein [Thermodesulfovibrio sp.]MDW7997939.1 DUF58 domain-containing protein [Thermodesulfovibrio sp.]